MQYLLIEHLNNVFRQLTTTVQQPSRRRWVQRMHAAVIIPGEQVIRFAVDVARAAVGSQHLITLVAAYENIYSIFKRALHHHLPVQVLRAAVVV